MAVIGLSLLLATAVYLLVRPPPWLSAYLTSWRQPRIEGPPTRDHDAGVGSRGASVSASAGKGGSTEQKQQEKKQKDKRNRAAMPPPPLPPVIAPPKVIQAMEEEEKEEGSSEEEQTTPKAGPTSSSRNIPALSLEAPEPSPLPPRIFGPNSAQTLMPPPSRPAARPPTLNRLPANTASSSLSPTPSRNLPLPSRGPVAPSSSSSSSSGLAPPPTHSTKPSKPSKKVLLAPGRSPLDWARISSSPSADLRNLPPSTPYLRVTRSQLKTMNGRKGKDAWMALGGRVYNISPYTEYHPGGVGELLRGAAKDGTKLFGEVHPWVNYETMLQACLVGILVEDEDRAGGMEDMD